MRLKKRIIFIIFIIISLIVGGYFWKKKKAEELAIQAEIDLMHTVLTGDIKVDVKVTATAKLVDEQNLSFAQEGKITKVNVKVGREIKAGDVLAELDMEDYYKTIESAKLDLANTQLSLNKLLYNDTSLVEAQIQTQLNEANSSYSIESQQFEVLKKQLDTAMQQKNNQLEQQARDYKLAKESLEIAKTGLKVNIETETEQTTDSLQARNQTIDSIISDLRSHLNTAETIIESIDKIFGVSDKFDTNAGYITYLSAKNSTLKSQAETKILQAYTTINNYRMSIDSLDENSIDAKIYSVVSGFYKETEIIVELSDIALDAMDMSVVSSILTETMIQGFSSTATSSRSSAISLRNQLQILASSVNSLLSDSVQEGQLEVSIEQKQLNYDRQEQLVKNQEQNIRLLMTEIENLEKDHQNQLTRKQAQINTILERIEVLKKEIKDVQDGPDTYDIQQARNAIAQAKLRLERTKDRQDDYQIIAEFDGRVRSIDIVEGEQYELDDRQFIVIENPNLIEMELQVNQIDIVKIEKGNPVVVTFDAYPNNPIQAIIADRKVNPELNDRGGVYYKATVLLEKQEQEILAGMSSLVTITTAEVKNVVRIPILALKMKDSKQFVYIKKGDNYELKEVELGIMNNFEAEVLSGINKGDIIRTTALMEEDLETMGIDDGSDSPFGK